MRRSDVLESRIFEEIADVLVRRICEEEATVGGSKQLICRTLLSVIKDFQSDYWSFKKIIFFFFFKFTKPLDLAT